MTVVMKLELILKYFKTADFKVFTGLWLHYLKEDLHTIHIIKPLTLTKALKGTLHFAHKTESKGNFS